MLVTISLNVTVVESFLQVCSGVAKVTDRISVYRELHHGLGVKNYQRDFKVPVLTTVLYFL